MKIMIRTLVIFIGLLMAGPAVDSMFDTWRVTPDAEARIGRPLTPGSVAGVARRTTRRRIHRTAVYVAVLPVSCSTVVIEGMTLTKCGGTYYQPHGNQFVVVTVD